MSTHRERLDELRRRVVDEAGLGLPIPYVSTITAHLLADLVGELGAVVLELELLRAGAAEATVTVERDVDA